MPQLLAEETTKNKAIQAVTMTNGAINFNAVGSIIQSGQPIQSGNNALNVYVTGSSFVPPTNVYVGAHFPGYTAASGAGTSPANLAALSTELGYSFDFPLLFAGLPRNSSGLPDTATFYPDGSINTLGWSVIEDHLDTKDFVVLNYELLGTHQQILAGEFNNAIDNLAQRIISYRARKPGKWRPRKLKVKLLHEANLSGLAYSWVAFTDTNLTFANGGTPTTINSASRAVKNTAVNNFIQCFNLVASRLITAATVDGERLVDIIWEIGRDNFQGDAMPISRFVPNPANFDIISVNVYNRSGISSGYNYFQSFKASFLATYHEMQRLCPTKEFMIGEMSTTAAGTVTSVTVSNGGTGFPASTTFPLVLTHSGSVAPVLTATTNGSGQVTSIAVTDKGAGLRFVSITPNQNGGTGLTTTVNLLNPATKFSKGQWFIDALNFIKDESQNIRYVTLFLENKNVSAADNRDWAPNTSDSKEALTLALNTLNRRVDTPTTRQTIRPNLCPDPFTDVQSLWAIQGTNAGTLSFSTNVLNFPPDFVGRQVGRVTHTAVNDPEANQSIVTIDLPPEYFSNARGNENYTISLWAAFNPFARPATPLYNFDCTLISPDGTIIQRLPARQVRNQWGYYQFTIATGVQANVSSPNWKLAMRIGDINASGEFLFTMVKLEIGEDATPLYHPNIGLLQVPIRTITGTTVTQNARRGEINTGVLTTAAGATAQITLNNSFIRANGTRVKWYCDRYSGTFGTNGSPIIQPQNVIDGQATLLVRNIHATNALNGSLTLYYEIIEN